MALILHIIPWYLSAVGPLSPCLPDLFQLRSMFDRPNRFLMQLLGLCQRAALATSPGEGLPHRTPWAARSKDGHLLQGEGPLQTIPVQSQPFPLIHGWSSRAEELLWSHLILRAPHLDVTDFLLPTYILTPHPRFSAVRILGCVLSSPSKTCMSASPRARPRASSLCWRQPSFSMGSGTRWGAFRR